MIGRGPRSNYAIGKSSGWGAQNSDGSTNTMFTSADGFSSTFVCLGRHSFLGGRLSTLHGCLTCSARSGRAFLSTSRYFTSASSRLRKRYTLRFCERLSPSGHHRGRWYLSSSSGSESPWMVASHDCPDVFWALSAGTPMFRPAGVLAACAPSNHL